MGVFERNKEERREREVAKDRRKLSQSLGILKIDIEETMRDIRKDTEVLHKLVERERLDLPAGRSNIASRINKLAKSYTDLATEVGNGAKIVADGLTTVRYALEHETFTTRQQLAEQIGYALKSANEISNQAEKREKALIGEAQDQDRKRRAA